MPYLLERHKVYDYAWWREVFDADASNREAAGCRGARIFRNVQDQEEVVVPFEWDSPETARRRIESAELRVKFEEAGSAGHWGNRILPPPRGGGNPYGLSVGAED